MRRLDKAKIWSAKTGRPLNTRIAEHKRNTKMGEISMSKTAEHPWDEDHRMQWGKEEITHKEEKRIFILIKVSVFISTTEQTISQRSID
jgi:hypothetical protein